MKHNIAYIGLGSNLGNRVENLQKARQLIEEKIGVIINQSSIYETDAWGNTEQDSFLNQVVEIRTPLHPIDLIAVILKIEENLGRKRKVKWGPRLIDIDILYYADLIIKAPNLTIPHPYLHERRFVLVPLSEISANFIHPRYKKTNTMLLRECKDEGLVKKFSE